MQRNDNQTKIVLDPDQIELLRGALVLATEFSHGIAQVEQALGNDLEAARHRSQASKYQELLTYSPEVVRVAVTIETPSIYAVQ